MDASHDFLFGDNLIAALAARIVDFGIELLLWYKVPISFLYNLIFGLD